MRPRAPVLERLHQRGVKGEQIAPALYVQPGLLMLWSHEPIAPWQDRELRGFFR